MSARPDHSYHFFQIQLSFIKIVEGQEADNEIKGIVMHGKFMVFYPEEHQTALFQLGTQKEGAPTVMNAIQQRIPVVELHRAARGNQAGFLRAPFYAIAQVRRAIEGIHPVGAPYV